MEHEPVNRTAWKNIVSACVYAGEGSQWMPGRATFLAQGINPRILLTPSGKARLTAID